MRPTTLLRAAAQPPKQSTATPSALRHATRPVQPKSPLPGPLASPLRKISRPVPATSRLPTPSASSSRRPPTISAAAAGPSKAQPAEAPYVDKSLWQTYKEPKHKYLVGAMLTLFAGMMYAIDYLKPEEEEEAVETIFERKAREALGSAGQARVGVPPIQAVQVERIEQVERRPT